MKKSVQLPDLKKQTIITADYEDEMKQSYIDYAMSVIAARALPDIRDGLKPVQRRTLFAMRDLNLLPDRAYRKSARIVGDTMGKYHPHGDGSIYDSMVRMAQDFALKQQLIDGHGNFGSIDGDASAAMRYTEAKLQPIALELLGDIEKKVVEMKTNFDETLLEPTILPAKYPNALINGMTGIAVGMATSFPTHNLKEVIDGTIAYIKDPTLSVKDLMTYIQGPDFPTGGIVANKSELESIYATGKGRIRIQAKTVIEAGSNGRHHIIIKEIPYTIIGNKSNLIESIAEMVKNKKIVGIHDIRDESSRGEIEIIIETKKGVDPIKILNQLYKKTKLEDNFSVNMLALLDKKPYLYNLKSAIEAFVSFQKEIYTKRYQFLLDKELDKKETTEGLLKAYDEIDLIIETIRGAKNLKSAKKCLITGDTTDITYKTKKSEALAKKFNYTERQATVILEMKLYKLIGLEKLEVEKQHQIILKHIEEYQKILSSEKVLNHTMIVELKSIADKYGKKRKTSIQDIESMDIKEEIELEEVFILVDSRNYAKAIDTSNYEKNVTKVENEMKLVLQAQTDESIHLIDKNGNLHQIKVLDIPRTKWMDKGLPLSVLTDIKEKDIILIDKLEIDANYLFITSKGLIKSVQGNCLNSKRSRLAATKLEEGDSIQKVVKAEDCEELLSITEKGYALRIRTDEIPEMKRNAKGVSLLKMEESDTIVDICYIHPSQKTIQIQLEDEVVNKYLSAIPLKKRNSIGKQIIKNKTIMRFVSED